MGRCDDCDSCTRQLADGGVMTRDVGEGSWTGLNPAQANGQACVICGHSVPTTGSMCVPVGRSPTESQVYACMGSCADLARPPAGLLPIPDEALTAGGAAFLHVLERITPTGDPRQAYPDDLVSATVRAAAPLIVAVELRRLAKQIQGNTCGHQWLRERADQLYPRGQR